MDRPVRKRAGWMATQPNPVRLLLATQLDPLLIVFSSSPVFFFSFQQHSPKKTVNKKDIGGGRKLGHIKNKVRRAHARSALLFSLLTHKNHTIM